MKLTHFDAFAPRCPVCRAAGRGAHRLSVGHVARRQGDDIIEGTLHCGEACSMEYAVVDGIPLLVPDPLRFMADNLVYLLQRDDLSAHTMSVLTDGGGADGWLAVTRRHLSTYAWDHYGERDPDGPQSPPPGSARRSLMAGLEMAGGIGDGLVLEVGCSVGGNTLALAEQTSGLVLGVDINIPMLRLARRALSGAVRYPLRQGGIVYDVRPVTTAAVGAERVDFWACDALALPFADGALDGLVALNVLDCVPSPLGFLEEIGRLLKAAAPAVLCTPYDWTPGVTPAEQWIGGHSQRSELAGDSAAFLRQLLTPGAHPQSVSTLALEAEVEALPWTVRVHARSVMHYAVHLLVARGR